MFHNIACNYKWVKYDMLVFANCCGARGIQSTLGQCIVISNSTLHRSVSCQAVVDYFLVNAHPAVSLLTYRSSNVLDTDAEYQIVLLL